MLSVVFDDIMLFDVYCVVGELLLFFDLVFEDVFECLVE